LRYIYAMITIEKTVDISADRRLHLDLTLPKTVPSGKTSVVLVFPSVEAPVPAEQETRSAYAPEIFPAIEELKAEARQKTTERFAEMEKTGVDPLQKYCGILKDVFPEDGLEYQRWMRDEWPD
jgi:hypothetical protein